MIGGIPVIIIVVLTGVKFDFKVEMSHLEFMKIYLRNYARNVKES